jgi:hypothetical protein
LLRNSIYTLLGSTASVYFRSLSVLMLNQTVLPSNLHASVPSVAQAGSTLRLLVQARASLGAGNATGLSCAALPALCFGANLTWATGLAAGLTVNVISATASRLGGAVVVTPAAVSELGGGLYAAQCGVQQGSVLQVVVRLDEQDVPGSPFPVALLPAPPTSAASFAAGAGLVAVMESATGAFVLQPCDPWGNAAVAKTLPAPPVGVGVVTMVVPAAVPPAGWCVPGSNSSTAASGPSALVGVADNGNGSYTVRYASPPGPGDFWACVLLQGAPVGGMPVRVSGLASPAVPAHVKVAFRVLAALVIALMMLLLAGVWAYRNESRFRAASPTFLASALVGCSVLASSVFPRTVDGADAACMAFPLLLSLGVLLMLLSVFVKTWRIQQIFASSRLLKPVVVSDSQLGLALGLALLLEVAYDAAWWATAPLVAAQQALSTSPAQHFPVCAASSAGTAWLLVRLGDKALLLLYGVYLAVKISSVQDERYNESGAIGVVLYNTALCTAVAAALTAALPDNPTAVMAVQSSAILVSALVCAGLMVGQKVIQNLCFVFL